MERVCVCEPVPHERVHVLQALQAETAQSMGHAITMHDLVAERAPHEAPPWAALKASVRERSVVPEPQVLEQSLQADQGEGTQSTGHSELLHVADSEDRKSVV